MHQEITVAIPGAKNNNQLSKNVNAVDLDDISSLMPSIKDVYSQYLKEDIHHRW
jgi:aryl-alcohol dehydrogenase-like predicted oxidoreductase